MGRSKKHHKKFRPPVNVGNTVGESKGVALKIDTNFTDGSPNSINTVDGGFIKLETDELEEKPVLGMGYANPAKLYGRIRQDSGGIDFDGNFTTTPPFKPSEEYLRAKNSLLQNGEYFSNLTPTAGSPAVHISTEKGWDEAEEFLRSLWVDDPDEPNEKELAPTSFWEYFLWDIGWRTDDIEYEEVAKDDVLNFLKVPVQVEYLMLFGFFACCDALLFALVYLPIRIIWAFCILPVNIVLPPSLIPKYLSFHRAHLYDLLRAIILSIGLGFLLQFHMSRIYHYVRGQAFIKLYVIFNMLDIFDRLMCSIGQDIVESLWYSSKTSPKAVFHVSLRLILCSIYVTLHSFLYFVRLITLNAAINSQSNALLTILISNNFVELKGSVFKRFAEQNLFQITCADIVERFELFIFILLTAMQQTESWYEFFYGSVGYIIACELMVDWLKHAFITKFNKIRPSCYENFLEALCRDFVPTREHKQSGPQVDPSQAVSHRIGLATLPLTCVILRFLWVLCPEGLQKLNVPNALFFSLLFLCALTTKSLLNISLRGFSCRTIITRESRIISMAMLRYRGSPAMKSQSEDDARKKHQKEIDKLSEIKRYQIYKSRLPT